MEGGEERGGDPAATCGPVSSHFYRWSILSPVSGGSIPLVPAHNVHTLMYAHAHTHTHTLTHTRTHWGQPSGPSSSSHKLGQPLPHPQSNRWLAKCSLLSTAPAAASRSPELLEGHSGQGSGAEPSARGPGSGLIDAHMQWLFGGLQEAGPFVLSERNHDNHPMRTPLVRLPLALSLPSSQEHRRRPRPFSSLC